MLNIRTLLLTIAVFALSCLAVPDAMAENAVIASGAGYKKMVNALNAAYHKETGRSVDLLFGNMAKVTTLARQSGNVDIVLGDETFLNKAGLALAATQVLGEGRLVLAFAKGSRFSGVEDLDNPEAGRIALPDVSKAIYGKGARQFLQNTGRLPGIQPRLVEVATIPQVFAYLTTGEVDMGFMNLTHTLNVADKLGGYVILDNSKHSKIVILAGLLADSRHMDAARDFLRFMATDKAQAIIRDNGL